MAQVLFDHSPLNATQSVTLFEIPIGVPSKPLRSFNEFHRPMTWLLVSLSLSLSLSHSHFLSSFSPRFWSFFSHFLSLLANSLLLPFIFFSSFSPFLFSHRRNSCDSVSSNFYWSSCFTCPDYFTTDHFGPGKKRQSEKRFVSISQYFSLSLSLSLLHTHISTIEQVSSQ